MSAPELEPIGHLKFGPAGGDKPEQPGTPTFAQWCDWSKDEYRLLHHYTIPILNGDDKALEKKMRSGGDTEEMVTAFLKLVDHCDYWIDRYKAAIEVLERATARILVVAERVSETPEEGRAR